MAYTAAKCHALLMPSGTQHDPDKKHLFVVCTDCCKNGFHLLLSITGWTNNLCDPTHRLAAGTHPFITKESYVFYRKARIESAVDLAAGVAQGILLERDPFPADVVAAMLKGVCESVQTPRKIRNYANCPPRQ